METKEIKMKKRGEQKESYVKEEIEGIRSSYKQLSFQVEKQMKVSVSQRIIFKKYQVL